MKSSPLMRLLARSLLVTLLVSLGISLGWSGPLAPAAAATSYGLVRTYLKPNAEAGDDFGRSVAWVGANVLVGAPQPNSATSPGEAYLLDRLTGADLALFIEPSPAPGEKFGSSVALAGDRVIIGTPDEGTLALQAGAAYLFGSDGAPLHSFTNPGVPPITFDTFGSSVAGVGSDILIGAPNDDEGATNAGIAYLFNGSTFSLTQTFTNPVPGFGDSFGFSVAALGSDVLIGAPFDTVTTTIFAGAVYRFNISGALLTTYAKTTPAAGDEFGSSIAAFDNYVLIGAPSDDTSATNAGAAYLFDGPTGALLQTIQKPNPAANDHFGVAVAGFGDYLLIGAPDVDVISGTQTITDAGAAYLFDLNGVHQQTFSNPTPGETDAFGASVAAQTDLFLVGAPADDTAAQDAGAVYLFGVPPRNIFLPLIARN